VIYATAGLDAAEAAMRLGLNAMTAVGIDGRELRS
jgi:hypothetical protein